MPPSRLLVTIITSIVVGITGCPSSTAKTPASPTMLIEATTYRGVLFSATEAERQRLDAPMTADTLEFWSPSAEDVARMEAQILPALLTDERLSDGVGWNPVQSLEAALPDYTRQYFGYFTADGEAVIYTSFFCDVPIEELTMGVAIDDGGDCFFQIHYNTDTDEYFDLHVNGEA
ncbi:MAG: hypothetical protein AAFY67_14340 [Cyanobacteria bacterium J06642_9]